MSNEQILQSINDAVDKLSVKFTNRPIKISTEKEVIKIFHERNRTKIITYYKESGNLKIVFIY